VELKSLSDASNEEILEKVRQIVLSDTPFGFAVFYSVMSNQVLPAHCAEWIDELYYARNHEMGFANEAFRGSLKTTIITDYFTAYQIGLYTKNTNLFAQSNDDKASMNSKFTADLIANSNEWKLFFPHVRPDEGMGWGQKGYFVQRTDLDYGKWRRGASKDPTLIGAGYKSSDILGMHPTGVLTIDDINDEKNTRSKRELDAAVKKWEAEIRPAAIEGVTFEIFNFTPWVPGDVGDKVKNEKGIHHIQTPICLDRDINKPVWPEMYPAKTLERLRNKHSPAEWARMYLLDLEAMKGVTLRREWLHWYPHTDIKEEWPVVIGVDYASVEDVQEKKGRDYFALAVLKKVPGGGLILVDGIRAHLTQGQAEDEVVAWRDFYGSRCHLIGVEALGGGLTFYGSLLRLAKLPLRRSTVGNKSKGIRFEKGLGPLFRRGRIYISDAPDNEFIGQFVDEWVSWSGDSDGKYPNDILDAVFHAVECARGNILADEHSDIEMPEIDKKNRNPMLAFSRR
jgi:hypothetical protein